MQHQGRRTAAYVAVPLALAVAGVVTVGWGLGHVTWQHAAAAALAGAALEFLRVRVRDQVALSMVNVATFTAVILGGAPLAVWAAPGAALGNLRGLTRPRGPRLAFNFGELAVSAAAAGLVFEALSPLPGGGGIPGVDQLAALAGVRGVLALLAAAGAYTAVNFGLVTAIVWLASGERPASTMRSITRAALLQPLYLALSVLGAVLLVAVGPVAVALLIVPALVARTGLLAFEQELDAYDELVLALVKIIEVKDGYTRGHAERVAQLAVAVAAEVGYGYEDQRRVRYAALLHDVGKVAVPLHILRKPAALTDEEYQRVKTHPEVGAELLRTIEFLSASLPGVLQHHERLDGRGYPTGLGGRTIAEQARLISVVDAFDAMTSTRSYRRALSVEEARRRIREAAGTQFDPRFVDAFERVIVRLDWRPTDRRPEDLDVWIEADELGLEVAT